MFTLDNVIVKSILKIEHLMIPKGITAIVGESGAGKSTLLRLLNKLTPIDSGTIYYKNTSLAEIDAIQLRRNVVMLQQQPLIFPGTIRENLLAGCILAEKPQTTDAALIELLARLQLSKALTDHAEKLSGGEKQRLSIGRILLTQPEALLLDEPTSALDDGTAEHIMQLLAEKSAAHNLPIVVVTHSQRIAREFGNTIIALHKGRILSVKEASA